MTSIDLPCTEGIARVSFRPAIAGALVIVALDQFSRLNLEDLRDRLQAAAVNWQVAVEVQLLTRSPK